MTTDETEWQETDLALVEKQYEEYVKNSNRRMAKRPPQGKSVWRALPPRKDRPATPFKETYVHYVHDPATGNLVVVGECPVKTGKGLVCIPCQVVGKLKREGKKEAAEDMQAGWHGYMAAVRVDVDSPAESRPEVLDLPRGIFEKLNKLFKEKVAAGGDFTHPEHGYDLVIDRTGEGKQGTKYDVLLARAPSPILNRAWLKKIPDLEEVAGQFSNDQVAALFSGEAAAPDTSFPHGANAPQPALGPAPETNAQGQWAHPSQAKR